MNLSCREIVKELDAHIVSQSEAKRAVAIALRNRYRRSKLSSADREEITPKNIIMKGPTGVGKTEIARRLAKLVNAPFIKVEATKYTEVGYVGRDVESMIRDLVEASIRLVRDEKRKDVEMRARDQVENKLIDLVIEAKKAEQGELSFEDFSAKIREEVLAGKHEDTIVEMIVKETPKQMEIGIGNGNEVNFGEIIGSFVGGGKRVKKHIPVKKARENLINDEVDKLIDNDACVEEGLMRAEQEGIIFIDEFDKIAMKGKQGGGNGPDVSREGVQRDILPIVEGTTVNTKYGIVHTDYILFIAAGAFHVARPEDLIPELQGRFPIRVELKSLTKEDYARILTEPKYNIIMQYQKLLAVDNVDLVFEKDAIDKISELAETENETGENIGARRLFSIMEKLLDDISFTASENKNLTQVKVTKTMVEKTFEKDIKTFDIKKYII